MQLAQRAALHIDEMTGMFLYESLCPESVASSRAFDSIVEVPQGRRSGRIFEFRPSEGWMIRI